MLAEVSIKVLVKVVLAKLSKKSIGRRMCNIVFNEVLALVKVLAILSKSIDINPAYIYI